MNAAMPARLVSACASPAAPGEGGGVCTHTVGVEQRIRLLQQTAAGEFQPLLLGPDAVRLLELEGLDADEARGAQALREHARRDRRTVHLRHRLPDQVAEVLGPMVGRHRAVVAVGHRCAGSVRTGTGRGRGATAGFGELDVAARFETAEGRLVSGGVEGRWATAGTPRTARSPIARFPERLRAAR